MGLFKVDRNFMRANIAHSIRFTEELDEMLNEVCLLYTSFKIFHKFHEPHDALFRHRIIDRSPHAADCTVSVSYTHLL